MAEERAPTRNRRELRSVIAAAIGIIGGVASAAPCGDRVDNPRRPA
jgi:hypothetical protein